MSRLLRRLTSSRAMGASPQSASSAGNAAAATLSPPVLWTVRVRIVEASDLMEKRLVLRAAPHCFLQLGAVRFTTARVKGSLDPVFPDETFAFNIHNDVRSVGFVLLAVFDSQLLGEDDFLGEVRLPLHDLMPDTPVDVWMPLRPRHPRDPVSGELHILVDLVPRLQSSVSLPPWAGLSVAAYDNSGAASGSLDSQDPGGAVAPIRSHPGIITVADTIMHSQVAVGSTAQFSEDSSAVVSVIILEAKNLVPDDRRRPIEPYVKLRLGAQDSISTRTISDVEGVARQERREGLVTDPVWTERFEFRVNNVAQDLAFEVKTRHILRTKLLASHSSSVAVLTPEPNRTYELWLPMELAPDIPRSQAAVNPPRLHILVTRHQPCREEHVPAFDRLIPLLPSYSAGFSRVLGDSQLGWLRVTLLRAGQGLVTASGASPNAVVRLDLGRVYHRSQTKWHNANPIWDGEIFDFPIVDVSDSLDLILLHETGEYNADAPVNATEFLGGRRLSLQDLAALDGQHLWLPLKDIDLVKSCQGALLVKIEISLDRWNAAMSLRNTPVQLICPCSGENLIQPHKRGCNNLNFKLAHLKRNVERLSTLIDEVEAFSDYIDDIFDWKDPGFTAFVFFLYLIVIYFFRPWMPPLAGVLLLSWTRYRRLNAAGKHSSTNGTASRNTVDAVDTGPAAVASQTVEPSAIPPPSSSNARTTATLEVDNRSSPTDGEEWSNRLSDDAVADEFEKPDGLFFKLKEKRAQILRYPGLAQNRIGLIAGFGERLKNTSNWTQPFLSGTLFWALFALTVTLCLFPAQHVLAAIGIVIFSEHWRVPQRTNAVANFIDRVSDDMELLYQTAVIGANDGQDWRIATQTTSPASMQPPTADGESELMASFLQTVNATASTDGPGSPRGSSPSLLRRAPRARVTGSNSLRSIFRRRRPGSEAPSSPAPRPKQ